MRDNEHWYLPGGKIEPGESPQRALERELAEELGIAADPTTERYLYTVRGPAYGQAGEVELICFSAQWSGSPSPRGEVSEVGCGERRSRRASHPRCAFSARTTFADAAC